MKNLQFLTIMALLTLAACAKGGGGGGGAGGGSSGGGGGSPPSPPIATLNSSETGGYHFGMVTPGVTKSKTITIVNIGTKAANALTLNTGGKFSIANDTCSTVALAPAATCTFDLRFLPDAENSFVSSVVVSGGSSNLTIPVGGRGAAVADRFGSSGASLDTILLLGQDSFDGTWNSIGYTYDLGTTLAAANVLVKAKEKINFSTDLFSGGSNLTTTLKYLERTTAGGGGERNIDYLGDRDTIIPEWLRPYPTAGMKVKEVPVYLPLVHENLTQAKNSSTASSYAYANAFLDAYRVQGNTAHMFAYLSKLFDYSYWNYLSDQSVDNNSNGVADMLETSYAIYAELGIRDIYLSLNLLRQYNKTTQFEQIAQVYPLMYAFYDNELSAELGFPPSYSAAAFDNSSFTLAQFKQPVTNNKLALVDFTGTCRQSAMQLLNFAYIHKYSTTLTAAQKNDLLAPMASLKNLLVDKLGSCGVSTTGCGQYSESERSGSPDYYTQSVCIPALALAAYLSPRNLFSPTEVNTLTNRLLNKIDDFAYDDCPLMSTCTSAGASQGDNNARILAIDALTQMFNN